MTNHEVLLRLSINQHDDMAVASLHDNNAKIIRTTVIRYFGTGTVPDNVEGTLTQRMADHAECDRLRNEAIRDKANKD